MQLAHAGRKGGTKPPWWGGKKVPPEEGGWEPVAPCTEPFDKDYPRPRALTAGEVREIAEAFRRAAERAFAAGFEVLEIHSAHDYLLHEFLSPLSNFRQDEFGGSFENRIRVVLQVIEAVRQIWPARLPLFVRVSATDWKEGGWDLEQTIELSKRLKRLGVDLIDVSSGGVVPGVQIPVGPGYQVKFAEEIRLPSRSKPMLF
jgi:2,4-dienoyl-CoA reductase-like NADH-dependent reductase (Old Yellow Enzyme family)